MNRKDWFEGKEKGVPLLIDAHIRCSHCDYAFDNHLDVGCGHVKKIHWDRFNAWLLMGGSGNEAGSQGPSDDWEPPDLSPFI